MRVKGCPYKKTCKFDCANCDYGKQYARLYGTIERLRRRIKELEGQKMQEESLNNSGNIPDKTVYRLCVGDVICFLKDSGCFGSLTSEQVEELSDYVGKHLSIPYDEYIMACIETHDKFEEWTSQSPKD